MCWGRARRTRVELGRGFWQCIGAGRCKGAHKQTELKTRKRSKVGGGDKPERQSNENNTRAPTYGARRDAAWSTGARLPPWGVCCALGIPCPSCASWPSSTTVGSGIQLCLHSSLSVAVTPQRASRELQLPPPFFLFLSTCQDWELSKQVYAWVQKLQLPRTVWFLGL